MVNDSPGFATSRLGVLLGLEAIRMLEEGVADAESIDRAMELGYRHPMGPLWSTDLVGLDIRLAVADYLHGKLGSGSHRRSCCATRSPAANSVESPVAGSTTGADGAPRMGYRASKRMSLSRPFT